MSQLETNTTTMQAILAAVNALPEAGSGGSVGTCTVTINGDDTHRPYYISYMTDGDVPAKVITNNSSNSISLQKVLCGSVVTVSFYGSLTSTTFFGKTTNAELMACRDYAFCAFRITAPSGGTATIDNSMLTSGGGRD